VFEQGNCLIHPDEQVVGSSLHAGNRFGRATMAIDEQRFVLGQQIIRWMRLDHEHLIIGANEVAGIRAKGLL
jgi:hypothetical protein